MIEKVSKSGKTSNGIPRSVIACLRALGVEFKNGRSFWLVNDGALEWILKDAHDQWRNKIKVAHTDRGGTHEEAAMWNGIWDRVKNIFASKSVALDDRKPIRALPREKVYRPKARAPKPAKAPMTAAQRSFRYYRRMTGTPLDAPLYFTLTRAGGSGGRAPVKLREVA